MKRSSSNIKQNLIFPEMELSSLIFSLYFRKELFVLEKKKKTALKKFLISREIELSSPKLKKL